MKIRVLTLSLLVASLCGAQLAACSGDDERETGPDGGSSGNQQTSSSSGETGASSGGSSSGGASSSSSSSGSLSSSSSSGEGASSSSSSSGGDSDAATSSSGSLGDGGTSSSGGETDAGVDAGPPSNDPFDPSSCAGSAWPAADALTSLNGDAFREVGRATMMHRSRTCPGGNVNECGPWGAPEILVKSLLTYSGGVVTDYKQFTFPTLLFLYAEQGIAKYSIRHELDHAHEPNDVDHGILFSSGDSPMTNPFPRIYVWDPNPAPNRYQDLEGRLGDTATLFVGPHCARYVAPWSYSGEIAALYRY